MSWFGATVSVSNGVASIGPTSSTFKSDYKYLLFTAQSAVPIPSDNYSMAASFAYNAHDSNFLWSAITVIILSLCEGYLVYYSWAPFSYNYHYFRALNDLLPQDTVEQTTESDGNEIHPLHFYDPEDPSIATD